MARLIKLDDLMKFPIRIGHYDKEHGNETFVLGIETVLEYAENLPPVDAVEVVQRWIPVTERLPEELKNVLAYTDVGSFAETARWTGHRWEKTWDFEVLYGVTHWMPLPEPPGEVE